MNTERGGRMATSYNIAVSAIVFSLLGLAIVHAEDTVQVQANADVETQGNVGGLFWKVRVLLDRADVALTLDQEKKAEKSLQKAKKRLAEVEAAIAAGNVEAAAEAQAEHERLVARANARLVGLEAEAGAENEKEKQKLEILLQKHADESEKTAARLKAKVRGELSAEERVALEELVEEVKSSTDFRIQLDINGEKTIIRQRTTINGDNETANFTKVEIEIHENFAVAHVNSRQGNQRINALFKLSTTNEAEIYSRLSAETGIPESELRANAKVKVSSEPETDDGDSGTNANVRSRSRVKVGTNGISVQSNTEAEVD